MQPLTENARLIVQPLAQQAFVSGFSTILWVAGLMALLGALLVGTLMRNPIPAVESWRSPPNRPWPSS